MPEKDLKPRALPSGPEALRSAGHTVADAALSSGAIDEYAERERQQDRYQPLRPPLAMGGGD